MEDRRKTQNMLGATPNNSKNSSNSRNCRSINKESGVNGEDWFRAGATAAGRKGGAVGVPSTTGSRCRLSPESDNDLEDISGDEEDIHLTHRHEASCRSRTLRFLEANPLQVALYLLVVLDAIVVIAEILLDLHAMRSQYGEATSDLQEAMNFLKETYSLELDDCQKDNIRYILDTLRSQQRLANDSIQRFRDPSGITFSIQQTSTLPQSHSRSRVNRTSQNGIKPLPDEETEEHGSYENGLFNDHREKTPDRKTLKFKPHSSAPGSVLQAGKEGELEDDKRDTNLDRSMSNESSISTKNTCSKNSSYVDRLLKIAHLFHYVGVGILSSFVIQVSLKIYGMGLGFFKKKLEIFDAVIVMTSFALDLLFVFEGIDVTGEEAIALLIIFLLWRILRIINGIMVTSKKRHELRIQLLKRGRRRAQKKFEYLEDDKNWKEREIANLRILCNDRGATEEEITLCRPRRRTIFQRMDTSFGLSTIASLSLGISMSMTGSGRAVIESLSATELRRPTMSSLGAPTGGGGIARRRQSFQQLFTAGSSLGPSRSEAFARRPSFVGILQQMSAQNRLLDRCGPETGQQGKLVADSFPRPASTMDRVPEEQAEMKRTEGQNETRKTSSNEAPTSDGIVSKDRSRNLELPVEHHEVSGPLRSVSSPLSTEVFFHLGDKFMMPEVVVHAPDTISPTTSKGSTKDIPVPGIQVTEESSSLVLSSTGSEEREPFCHPPESPPKTSSSLPQLSVSKPPGRGATRRRGNLSLGSLASRVPRAWKRSPNDSHDGRDTRWNKWNSTVTVDPQGKGTSAVNGHMPFEDEVISPTVGQEKRPLGCFPSHSSVDKTSRATSDLESNHSVDVGDGCIRRSSGAKGQGHIPRAANRKRLFQVAWSRSQELQPRRFHHEIVGFSKLVTRRKSSHCVYSESTGPDNAMCFL